MNFGKGAMYSKKHSIIRYGVLLSMIMASSGFVYSNPNRPASADVSRIDPLKKEVQIPNQLPKAAKKRAIKEQIKPPEGANKIPFQLKDIRFKGARVFKADDLKPIYQEYLNKEITLDKVWKIAQDITNFYHNEGYFLSRAYVPRQELTNGIVEIGITEGYIADVTIDDKETERYALIQNLITRLTRQQPLTAQDLESFMLQINDIPGQEFRAVLEPLENGLDGQSRLMLTKIEQKGTLAFNFDNFGSDFLGPYQSSITYQDSFLPLQQTTLSFLSSFPFEDIGHEDIGEELRYFAFGHDFHFAPDFKINFNWSYIASNPGAELAVNDIENTSSQLGIGLHYQPIRHRQENLVFAFDLAGKNTNGDILSNTPLTRDRIRKVTGSVKYDTSDNWLGYNYLNFDLDQGMKIFGATEQGDANISRSEAEADFTTVNVSYIRQQAIDKNFMAIARTAGQVASGPLFAAEEFGYGGQSFGRAYDPSELTGDHGVSGGLELRYLGISPVYKFNFTPYSFYDYGIVWNEGIDEIRRQHASSIGGGVKLSHKTGFTGDLGVAWPLMRDIENPITGNGKNPRIIVQMGYQF